MAPIRAYTTIEQSRKLAEILPLESADMYLWSSGKRYYAWSLAALLGVLPFPQLSKDKLGSGKVGWMVSVYPNDCRYDSCWHDNPLDACVDMIIKLNELNLL